jgi:hypothetical protein
MNRIDFLKNLFGVGLLGFYGLNKQEQLKIKGDAKEIYHSYVRGLVHSPGKSIIHLMKQNEPLKMVREPQNPYDEMAIALYYQSTKIGYVAAEDNYLLSQMLDIGHGHFTAEISAVHMDAPYWEKVSYSIFSHQV